MLQRSLFNLIPQWQLYRNLYSQQCFDIGESHSKIICLLLRNNLQSGSQTFLTTNKATSHLRHDPGSSQHLPKGVPKRKPADAARKNREETQGAREGERTSVRSFRQASPNFFFFAAVFQVRGAYQPTAWKRFFREKNTSTTFPQYYDSGFLSKFLTGLCHFYDHWKQLIIIHEVSSRKINCEEDYM